VGVIMITLLVLTPSEADIVNYGYKVTAANYTSGCLWLEHPEEL